MSQLRNIKIALIAGIAGSGGSYLAEHIVNLFAYINPRRADLFATAFARQVARIEAGLQEELVHGNLDSVRTMIDVRDAMEAYWLAIQKCEPGEACNIGGTTTISVRDFLDILKKLEKAKIPSRVDPQLLRPSDVTLQIPDVSNLSRQLAGNRNILLKKASSTCWNIGGSR